jgi:ankyrin repeat protein/energy-coupling factor transporter ATP-binding protein EcfA2
VVKLLVKAEADADVVSLGQTPLLLAARACSGPLVTALLKGKLNVNATSKSDGSTSLMLCADKVELVKLLLQKKATGAPRNDGMTPLMLAVSLSCVETVALMIKAKFDLNVASKEGVTALHVACKMKSFELMSMLLKGGADPNIALPKNEPVLCRALSMTNGTELAILLLNHGADPNAKDGTTNDEPVLHTATKNAMFKVVETLLKKGADVSMADSKGRLALSVATSDQMSKMLARALKRPNKGALKRYASQALSHTSVGEEDAGKKREVEQGEEEVMDEDEEEEEHDDNNEHENGEARSNSTNSEDSLEDEAGKDKEEEVSGDENFLCSRKVVLVGSTGQGKSTLANILLGHTTESVDMPFVVGHEAGSCTKESTIKEWDDGETRIRVVDTIGLGDTNLTEEQVLRMLIRSLNGCRPWVNQILFVMGGRVTKSELAAFRLFFQVVLSSDALPFTTLVRSKFKPFRDRSECVADLEAIRGQSEESMQVMDSIADKVWVENSLGTEVAKESRFILLDHLAVCAERYFIPPASEMKRRMKLYLAMSRDPGKSHLLLEGEMNRLVKEKEKADKASSRAIENAMKAARKADAAQEKLEAQLSEIQNRPGGYD